MSTAPRWVAFWNEREPPTTLALIRISLAVVVLFDLGSLAAQGALTWLWGAPEAGGIAVWGPEEAPLFYRIFPATPGSAQLLWVGLACSALCVGLGVALHQLRRLAGEAVRPARRVPGDRDGRGRHGPRLVRGRIPRRAGEHRRRTGGRGVAGGRRWLGLTACRAVGVTPRRTVGGGSTRR